MKFKQYGLKSCSIFIYQKFLFIFYETASNAYLGTLNCLFIWKRMNKQTSKPEVQTTETSTKTVIVSVTCKSHGKGNVCEEMHTTSMRIFILFT